ncbi:unnamed protein product [Brachionus calyciflorus]|nr:unnamed protein product [Brachionus calyciflorus]
MVYSSSTIETLSYLNEEKSKESLLNMLNLIEMTEKKDNSKFLLEDALKQCENIFTLEKGMRAPDKGFGKQIIILTTEMVFKNNQAVEMIKKFSEKGIEITNIVMGNFNIDEIKDLDSKTYFLQNLDQNSLPDFVLNIQQYLAKESALIPKNTDEITLDEDETKYFRYSLENINSKKIIIILENLIGNSELYISFTNRYPDLEFNDKNDDDYEYNIYNMNETKELKIRKSIIQQELDVIEKSTEIFIAVVGMDIENGFKIRIIEKTFNNNYSNINKSSPMFPFYVLLFFIIKRSF